MVYKYTGIKHATKLINLLSKGERIRWSAELFYGSSAACFSFESEHTENNIMEDMMRREFVAKLGSR